MAEVAKPNEPNSRGLRSWFSHKLRPRSSANGKKATPPPPERKSYVPRYAQRDMLMSVPIADRPDQNGRPQSVRHQSACSDIGFMPTDPSSRSIRSVRPHLMPRNVSAPIGLSGSRSGTSTPGSIKTSYSHHGPSGSSSSANLSNFNSWRGEAGSSTPRSLQDFQIGSDSPHQRPMWENFDQVMSSVSLSELDRPPHRRKSSSSSYHSRGWSTNHHNYAPPRTVHTSDINGNQQSYFSHQGIPDKRRASVSSLNVTKTPAPMDKGKGRASSETLSPVSRPGSGSMYGYHGELRLTAPSRLRNEHILEPVFDEEHESDDDGLYLRRPTTAATTIRTPSRRHSPAGQSPSRVYSTLFEQQEPTSGEVKPTETAESGTAASIAVQLPPPMQSESSSASFIESTTSEAPTDASKRSASTVSTAPTESSLSNSRPPSHFKEQTQEQERDASREAESDQPKPTLNVEPGVDVIQFEQPALPTVEAVKV